MASKRLEGRHHFRFFRAGGVDQVRIDTGADIVNLGELDQKLWVALTCPVKGLEFDERTLKFLDTDQDGRVRAPEIIAAVRWVGACLKNPDELTKNQDGLPLASIAETTQEGKQILAATRHILKSLGRENATAITVAESMATVEFFAKSRLNGDGVVPPDVLDDPETKQAAEDILACTGGELDRSGRPGISATTVDAFFAAAAAYDGWWQQAEDLGASVFPLDNETEAAYMTFRKVQPKVDDYFARCRLAAFDPRAEAALNREESAYLAVAAMDLSVDSHEVEHFPLAKVAPGHALVLNNGLNPAWHGSMQTLHSRVLKPIFGKDLNELTESTWAGLKHRFAAFEQWHEAKSGQAVETLGIERVRSILRSGVKDRLMQAIAEDAAIKPEVDSIEKVEKLTRYYRDLHVLLCNFVSFIDFYSQRRKAVFQAGTLFLDGRSCDLVFWVEDSAKHGVLATMAKSYLAYCDLSQPSTGEKRTVAAAFTAGDSDFLMVGRNGLFYDRKGQDWDATITKIIEQPISVRQAFLSPYKRFLRWVEEQVAKRAAAADAAAGDKMTLAVTPAGEIAPVGKPPPPKPKFDIGVLAAFGVAAGALGTAFGMMFSTFFGLGIYMPLGLLGLILLISGPSMVIAWLKLRQRNLGPILDAGGWAVNGRVKINIPFGRALTHMPKLPEGAERSLVDPYAEKRSPWPRVVLILLILGGLVYGAYKLRLLDVPLLWVEEKTGWELVEPVTPVEPVKPVTPDETGK